MISSVSAKPKVRCFNSASFGAIVAAMCLSTGALAGPQMEIVRPTMNFGRTTQSKVLTTDCFVKSIGDEPLKILVLWTGCGCAEMPLTDSTVNPGDSLRIRLKFSTGRMHGSVIKTPEIKTNASEDLILFHVLADVAVSPEDARPVVLLPEVVDVSQYSEKTRRMDKFTLENKSSEDLQVVVVDSAFKSFEIKVPDRLRAGETIEGKLRVIDSMVEKDFEESVTFLLKGREEHYCTLPVYRRYRPSGLDDN